MILVSVGMFFMSTHDIELHLRLLDNPVMVNMEKSKMLGIDDL